MSASGGRFDPRFGYGEYRPAPGKTLNERLDAIEPDNAGSIPALAVAIHECRAARLDRDLYRAAALYWRRRATFQMRMVFVLALGALQLGILLGILGAQ